MHKKFIPNLVRNPITNSITLQPPSHKSTIIWLHGLCDSSQGFLSFFSHSHSPLYHNSMKIKLLEAPMRRVAINSNMPCHAWYNMYTLDRFKNGQQEEKDVFNFDDINESLAAISEEIKHAAQQIYQADKQHPINPYHRIYLGGFSQGGVMALFHSLKSENVVGGAICFSGYALKSFEYKNFKKLPILLAHGKKDQVVRQIEAVKSYQHLLSDSSLVFYESFQNLEHSVCLEQLDLMSSWIADMDKMREKIYEKNRKQTQP